MMCPSHRSGQWEPDKYFIDDHAVMHGGFKTHTHASTYSFSLSGNLLICLGVWNRLGNEADPVGQAMRSLRAMGSSSCVMFH